MNIIDEKILSYPEKAASVARRIKHLIYESAENGSISNIEESLKWGEPSFKAPKGTPIRMDWKEKSPDKFFIFFNCQTSIINTLRVVFKDILDFEGTRSIVLNLDEALPEEILKRCFAVALKYHSLKNKPMLGM